MLVVVIERLVTRPALPLSADHVDDDRDEEGALLPTNDRRELRERDDERLLRDVLGRGCAGAHAAREAPQERKLGRERGRPRVVRRQRSAFECGDGRGGLSFSFLL